MRSLLPRTDILGNLLFNIPHHIHYSNILTEKQTKTITVIHSIFIEIMIIIWKFKAGEAELWLSKLCDCAVTQADLKQKALEKYMVHTKHQSVLHLT